MPQLDIPTGGLQETTVHTHPSRGNPPSSSMVFALLPGHPPQAPPLPTVCRLSKTAAMARKLKALISQSPEYLDLQMSLHFSGFHSPQISRRGWPLKV
ncbi:hypothetical protein CABS03_04588 [Colletotrichum abscissum]|uniref:Uncharacterized protein n=1 Tax=Colletotrichum abscissum TaxID=1671311 RepID=A0A9P9X504_9PEZI|nr:hypothetical protein CABS02_12593 [Colletotrichum abscissum]